MDSVSLSTSPVRIRPAPRSWQGRGLAFELSIYAGAYLVYLLTRGLVFPDLDAQGLANAGQVISLEQTLGLFWEHRCQAWALGHARSLVIALNWIYVITYLPIILATAAVLYLANRSVYYFYRRVFVVSLALALVVFALFPVAPPLQVSEYFVDTIQVFGPPGYGSRQMAAFYNPQAAVPSLHFTWTVILGVLFLRRIRRWGWVFGLAYPIVTFFAITITGNHYILDAVAGGLLAAVGFAVVQVWARQRPIAAPPVPTPSSILGRQD